MTLSELLNENASLRDSFNEIVDAELATMVRRKRQQIASLSDTSATSIATSAIIVESLIKILNRDYEWSGCKKELKRTLSQIVMHRIVDICSKNKLEKAGKESLAAQGSLANNSENHSEQLIDLARAVDKLAIINPEQAQAFILQTFQNTSIVLMSEIMNCSERKIALLLKSAKTWLAKKLAE